MSGLFGNSRQAYYQAEKRNYSKVVKADIILAFVDEQRKLMPRIGTRKLHHIMLNELPEEVHLGRDAFFNLLRDNHRLIRQKRSPVRTTDSNHWYQKYQNLIKEFTPDRANQLWVCDITYLRIAGGFVYLFLITDAYSRKIVGWSIGDTLEAKHAVSALNMALRQAKGNTTGLMHHSDRGIQYCSNAYVKILKKNNIKISMTENGDPLENAIAERINGVLKTEWINDLKLNKTDTINRKIDGIIKTYNNFRPHSSVEFMTPEMAHMQQGELKRLWKNYYRKQTIEMSNTGLP